MTTDDTRPVPHDDAGTPGGDAPGTLRAHDERDRGTGEAPGGTPWADDDPHRTQATPVVRDEPASRGSVPLGTPQAGAAPTTVLPGVTAAGAGAFAAADPADRSDRRPDRPDRPSAPGRAAAPRAAARRPRRARLVVQRVDPWSVFVFSLVASICLGVVLIVAVATLYAVLSGLGVLSSINNVLGEVLGGNEPDDVVQPFFTAGRVLGATAVLAAVDVVLLTVLATLSAFLYNLCASLTGGVEVQLRERD